MLRQSQLKYEGFKSVLFSWGQFTPQIIKRQLREETWSFQSQLHQTSADFLITIEKFEELNL